MIAERRDAEQVEMHETFLEWPCTTAVARLRVTFTDLSTQAVARSRPLNRPEPGRR